MTATGYVLAVVVLWALLAVAGGLLVGAVVRLADAWASRRSWHRSWGGVQECAVHPASLHNPQ